MLMIPFRGYLLRVFVMYLCVYVSVCCLEFGIFVEGEE